MSADAQRFASIVLTAFREAGHSTDSEVTRAGGPSTTTMTKLRAAASGHGELAEPRSQTWRAIDLAADWPSGSARSVWDGGDAPPRSVEVQPLGDPSEGLVAFEIFGNFGVRAVVKGPVRDLDALQAAVSKLIAGMQIDESNTRTAP